MWFPSQLCKLHEAAGGCHEQLEATHGYCRLEADVNNRWWVAEAGTSVSCCCLESAAENKLLRFRLVMSLYQHPR